jgi:hypothetical protein
MNPGIPMNILLDMYPPPKIETEEERMARIPVFKRGKPCPENKIKDPETKKCIKTNSIKGRKILNDLRYEYYRNIKGYFDETPLTIKYDNKQLTIPGHSDINPETDIPQRDRDCPPKTIRDPNNPDKCIKHNSKKGREIIANYRDYYKEVYGDSIPDYVDIPDFLPDNNRGERVTLPAIEKLTIKTALDKLQEQRLRARERQTELQEEIDELTNQRNEAERRRGVAEQQVIQLEQELEQELEQQGQRPNNVIERNGQALLYINDPNNINVVREYFEEGEEAFDRETFMNEMSDRYIGQQRNRIIRGGENMEFVNNPNIFNQIRQFFIANPDPRRTNFQTFLNLVNQRVNPRNYQY